jgi:hypothetical protein
VKNECHKKRGDEFNKREGRHKLEKEETVKKEASKTAP